MKKTKLKKKSGPVAFRKAGSFTSVWLSDFDRKRIAELQDLEGNRSMVELLRAAMLYIRELHNDDDEFHGIPTSVFRQIYEEAQAGADTSHLQTDLKDLVGAE